MDIAVFVDERKHTLICGIRAVVRTDLVLIVETRDDKLFEFDPDCRFVII